MADAIGPGDCINCNSTIDLHQMYQLHHDTFNEVPHMLRLRPRIGAIIVSATLSLCQLPAASAETLRLASPGDVLSLDPHASNISFTNYFLSNIYDGLVYRDRNFEIAGQLASGWKQPDPKTWIFTLRSGVKFHDGALLTADDVVFSFDRSRAPSSNFKHVLSSVESYRALDELNIEIKTRQPNPILLNDLLDLMIMSRSWSERNGAIQPLDLSKSSTAAAALSANGTGPYRVLQRSRGERTVLEAAPTYWGARGNIDRVVFTPIENTATMVSALLSKEIDLAMSLPIQDAKRVESDSALKIIAGPETRVMFLGMDQSRDELLESSIKGANPFKDKRVRQAFRLAISNRLIVDRIMSGQATAVGQMVMEKVTGYNHKLAVPTHDAAAAKKLLAEAGYEKGFEVGMDCPNNRFVNDAEICQAVVSMLARIGVKVNLAAVPQAQFYPKVIAPSYNTSFYLLGWTPATMDALNVFQNVLATRDPARGQGQWNIGGCSVQEADVLWKQAATTIETDKRLEMLREAMRIVTEEVCTIPLHAQQLIWGANRKLDLVQHPTSEFPIEMMSFR